MFFKTSYLGSSAKFPVQTFDWNVDDYLANQQKYPHLVDFFAKNDTIFTKYIIPFVDFDMNFTSKTDLPSVDEELAIRKALKKVFSDFFLNDNIKIVGAYRERGFATNKKKDKQSGEWVEHGKWKISYRLYANGVRTSQKDLLKHLKDYMPDLSEFPECVRNYSFDNNSLFDTGVYNDNNRSMACVGKTKTKFDKRILYREDDNEPLENFLIQNVQDTDEKVKWAKKTAFDMNKKQKTPKDTLKRTNAVIDDTPSEECSSEFVLVQDSDSDVEKQQIQPKKKKKKDIEKPVSSLNPLEEDITNLIVQTFGIRKSDLGPISEMEHAFVTFIKAPYYCLHTKCEHTESNPKMYVSVSRRKLKYQCDVCDKSFIKNHNVKIIADSFPTNDDLVKPCETLSLDKARRIVETSGKHALIHYLNNFLAKITHEDAIWYCIRDTIDSPWLVRGKSAFLAHVEHLSFIYKDEKEDGEIEECSFKISSWCFHENIRTFKNVILDPRQVGDVEGQYINLFQGFNAKRVSIVDMSKIKFLLDHCKNIICNGDEEFYNWLLQWQAHALQFPWIKMGTSPVFTGSQGTGKNAFFDYIGKYIYGKIHFFSTSSMDQLTGRFNAHQAKCLYTVANEVTFAGEHKQNNILKSKITETQIPLEKKGVDLIMIDSYIHFVFLSNNKDAIRIEDGGDGDRRFAVKRTARKPRRQHFVEYFARLDGEEMRQDVANHFYTYLLDMDLSDFDPREVPMTDEKREMAIFTRSPIDLFVDELLDGNIIKTPSRKQHIEGRFSGNEWVDGTYVDTEPEYFEIGEQYEMTMDELFGHYHKFCYEDKQGGRMSEQLSKRGFGKLIRQKVWIKNATTNRRGGTPITLKIEKIVEEVENV
ncbi:hypothetical protein DFS34DRAFT_673081 [Phlyctochytrium arcticum]|nr:hypothetical protein DFS34DRAFT_673081 [Phlyctochytrium arcticum]